MDVKLTAFLVVEKVNVLYENVEFILVYAACNDSILVLKINGNE